MWRAQNDGIAVIDPLHLAVNKLPPPVRIEQIQVDGKARDVTPGMRLAALPRNVWIDYTALSSAAPEKMRFRCKLEGQGRDWIEVVNEREARHSNRWPRQYRVRVQASNNDGVWNEAGASLDFSVDPAFYQTRWFQAARLAAPVASLWGMHRHRLHQIAQRLNVRMEERVGERTRIARELQDAMLQSFQGLMLRLQVVDEPLPPGKAKDELERTLERADQAPAEGRDRDAVRDLRSAASIADELAQALRDAGDAMAGEGGPAFRLVLEGAADELRPIVRDEICRISREAIRNAFHHGRAKRIELEITCADRSLRLRIRDDGNGVGPDILKRGQEGRYGLAGMREHAAQIGAKLNIWSRVGAGTEVDLSIPGSIACVTPAHSRRGLFWRKTG